MKRRQPFVLTGTGADGRSWRLELGKRTLLMGVLNLTPDSFSDGGKYLDPARAEARAWEMVEAGADILDVGGESTRPGADSVSESEQLRRIIPVLNRLGSDFRIPISIDTRLAQVAREACTAGAWIINDISALTADPQMVTTIAQLQSPVVLMHMRGTPENMQNSPVYEKVVDEVGKFLQARAQFAQAAGIRKDMVILDPGIGFGKTVEHNLRLLAGLPFLADLGYPLLVGPSRKSFIGQITGLPIDRRDGGTVGASVAGAFLGAHIIRVHDPGPIREALAVADEIGAMTG